MDSPSDSEKTKILDPKKRQKNNSSIFIPMDFYSWEWPFIVDLPINYLDDFGWMMLPTSNFF